MENNLIFEIGQRIQKYRLQNNLTQEQLSEKVGISQKHLSRIEKGYHNPRFDMIIHISDALNITTDALAKELPNNDVNLFLEGVRSDIKKLNENQRLFLKEIILLLKNMNI